MSKPDVLERAVDTFGTVSQMIVSIEEMSELQKELCKHLRGSDNKDAIAEEIADVEIMLDQLKLIFNCRYQVIDWRTKKLSRLEDRIKAATNP